MHAARLPLSVRDSIAAAWQVVLTRAGVAPDAMTALRALVASDKVFDSADLAKFQSAVSKDNERAALQVRPGFTAVLAAPLCGPFIVTAAHSCCRSSSL